MHPTFEEFKKLSRRGNLIALRRDLASDLETPVSAFLKVARKEPCAFLLESAEQEERVGRYSFLGIRPDKILISRGDEILIRQGKKIHVLAGKSDLLAVMRGILKPYRFINSKSLPNFAGGFVGFLSYENVRFFEPVDLKGKDGLLLDDAVFFFVKDFLFFDHFKKTLSMVSLCEVTSRTTSGLRRIYKQGIRRIAQIESRLKKKLTSRVINPAPYRQAHFEANMTRKEFEEKVRRVKEYIRAGDCIQVVLSQRFNLGQVQNDFEIYRALRSINPSPYMFYFRYGQLRLVGSSPELLVKKSGNEVEVCPIAGTRRRGKNRLEDARLEESLRKSVKEMAEHLMLVDLGRNDLGRVCQFSSIRVHDFAHVDRYSHVMHLVSSVRGRLRPGKDAFDLLRASFPAGTVTGAPKIRAMQIIDELEPEKRGPYAGSLGYFSFNHDMDMCIAIRTLVVSGRRAWIQAGAGIVFDSQPDREFEETLNKAKALMLALKGLSGIGEA